MANAHVFPGGVLDEDDSSADWAQYAHSKSVRELFPYKPEHAIDSRAMRICAVRELFEETGMMLVAPREDEPQATPSLPPLYSRVHQFASIDAQRAAQASSSASARSLIDVLTAERRLLSVGHLAPWSRWLTPDFEAERRRFDTMFYLAAVEQPFEQLTNDPKEVASACWLSPKEALHMAINKEIILPPPTTYVLHELEQLETIEQVFAQSVNQNRIESSRAG